MKAFIFVAAFLALASGANADSDADADAELDAKGRAKLAELMALIRENETCPKPESWAFDVIRLYMAAGKQAPPEEEIGAAQADTQALRAKIGEAKWCEYYEAEMAAAHAIVTMQNQ